MKNIMNDTLKTLDLIDELILKENIPLLEKALKNTKLKEIYLYEMLYFACKKNKKKVINFFFNDDRFSFSYQEIENCGSVKSAFEMACFFCDYDVVELFLQRNVNVFLNKEHILTSAATNQVKDPRILKKLLQISKEKNITLDYNYVLQDQVSTPYFDSIKTLLNDNRIDPLYNNNDFLFTLTLLDSTQYNIINKDPEILNLILNDSRFSFIPYKLKKFQETYLKLNHDPLALHKLFFSIPELENNLLTYLEENLNIFPENENIISLLLKIKKIKNF